MGKDTTQLPAAALTDASQLFDWLVFERHTSKPWGSHASHQLTEGWACCCARHCAVSKKDKFVKDNPGQMVITAGQIVWTAECEKALSDADGAKKALKLLKKKWVGYLNKLTAVTCSKLNTIDRNKVGATGKLQCLHLPTLHLRHAGTKRVVPPPAQLALIALLASTRSSCTRSDPTHTANYAGRALLAVLLTAGGGPDHH